MSTDNPNLSVKHVRNGHCAFAHDGPLAYQVWLAPADETDATQLGKFAEFLHAKYPTAISTIHLLRHGTGLPSSGAREQLSVTLKTYGDWFGEVGIVMEGMGFWAGAIRSMLTGLRIAAGGRGRLRLVGSVQEIAEWMVPVHAARTGVNLSRSRIVTALEELVERAR